jgi:hypothetical protein
MSNNTQLRGAFLMSVGAISMQYDVPVKVAISNSFKQDLIAALSNVVEDTPEEIEDWIDTNIDMFDFEYMSHPSEDIHTILANKVLTWYQQFDNLLRIPIGSIEERAMAAFLSFQTVVVRTKKLLHDNGYHFQAYNLYHTAERYYPEYYHEIEKNYLG